MDSGSQANPADPIDELHAQAVAETSAPVEALGEGSVESARPDSGPADFTPDDAAVCQEVLEAVLRDHSEAVHAEFFGKLAPVAGSQAAERIANRAAMSPEKQRSVARHTTRVLEKHGLCKYVSSEGMLAASLYGYWRQLQAARADMEQLLKECAAQNKQPKAA